HTISIQLTVTPPTHTLFPYTTLFRSARRGHAERVQAAAHADLDAGKLRIGEHAQLVEDAVRARLLDRLARPLRGRRRHVFRRGQDRKSTRLNSSHGSISYAVFCLKKT